MNCSLIYRLLAAVAVLTFMGQATPASPQLPAGCADVLAKTLAPGQAGYRALRLKDKAELVWVPGGEFKSGSMFGAYVELRFVADRKVDGFWLDEFEVTNRQYAGFCRQTGHATPALWRGAQSLRGRENQPVSGVSRDDAMRYAAWVGGRLPTEVEWEYAARGPKGLRYPWGEEFEPQNAIWCGSRPLTLTGPVGSIAANASWCGAMDLAGNVYEWVSGGFHGYEGTGGLEAKEGRAFDVLRGGSFYTMAECLKGSYRHLVRPGTVRADFGFRVAMDPARDHRPQAVATHPLIAERPATKRTPLRPLTMRRRRTPTGAGDRDWPLGRHDLQFSGMSPLKGKMVEPPKLRWEVTYGTSRQGTIPKSWSLVTDLDGDGKNELLWMPDDRLRCNGVDGQRRWTSDASAVDWVADVDEDGQVDLFCGGKIVSAFDGKVLWTPPELKGGIGQYFVGKFIPGLRGLQIAGASEGPDQSNWAHVLTFENGIASGKLLWEHLMHPPSLAHIRGTVGQLDGRWVVMCTPQGRIVIRDIATGDEVFRTEWLSGREMTRNYGLHYIADLDGDGQNEILLLDDFIPQLVAFKPRRKDKPMVWQHWIGWPGGTGKFYMQVATNSLARLTPIAPLEAVVSVHNLKVPGWALYGYDAVTGKINWQHPGLYLCAIEDLDSDGVMEIISERHPGPLKADFPGVEIGRVVGAGARRRYEKLWYRAGARLERNERELRRLDRGGYGLDEYLLFMADVDGDGKREFLVGVDEDSDLATDKIIAVGWGRAKVVEKAAWAVADGTSLRVIAWGDLRPELGPELLLGDSSGQVQVLSPKNECLHVFQRSAPEHPAGIGNISIADLDGDGKNELLGEIESGHVAAFKLPPEPDGSLVEMWRFRGRAVWNIYGSVHAVDTDGDDKKEVLLETGSTGGTGTLTLLNYDGSVRWCVAIPGTAVSATTHHAKVPAFGEFSGDNVLDVAVSRALLRDYTGGGGDMMALDGRTGATLWMADTGVYYSNVLNPFRAVPVWDYNHDGYDDIMGVVADEVYTLDGRDGSMLQLPADLTCKFNELKPGCSWTAWGSVVVADSGLDGEPDTVISTANIGVQGAWDLQTRKPLWINDPGSGYWGELPAMGDIDGDGRLEILIADSKFQYCIRDARTGKVRWDSKELGLPATCPTGVSCDIDGDGRTDFIQAWGGWLWALGCDEHGQPRVKWKVYTSLQCPPHPLIADFDNDGEAEIIIPGNPLRVYKSL